MKMSHKVVVKLSALDPSDDKQCKSFGRHLGIARAGIDRILEECLGSDAAIDGLSGDDSAGEDQDAPAGDTKVRKAKKKWRHVADPELRQILGEDVTIRAKIFVRWYGLHRPLLRPSMITSKRTVYSLLNIILGHVCSNRWRC